jgi:hypothetical protein
MSHVTANKIFVLSLGANFPPPGYDPLLHPAVASTSLNRAGGARARKSPRRTEVTQYSTTTHRTVE